MSGTITHHQITTIEREERDPGMNDRPWSTRKRASFAPKRGRHAGWENTTKARWNGGYHHFSPGWLLPRVVATVTASIVWGICGRMADMPEY